MLPSVPYANDFLCNMSSQTVLFQSKIPVGWSHKWQGSIPSWSDSVLWPKQPGCSCWTGTLLTFVQSFSWSFLIPSPNYCKKLFYSRSRALNCTFWSSWDPCELTSPAFFSSWLPAQWLLSQFGGVWSVHQQCAAWINVCSHHPRVTCWVRNRCISPPYCPGLLLYLAWNNFQTCVRDWQTGPEGRIPVLLQKTALTSVQSHFWHIACWLSLFLQIVELEPLNNLIWEALGSKQFQRWRNIVRKHHQMLAWI